MNLKNISKIAVVVILLSIPLTLIGHVIIHIPMLTQHFHLQNLINIGLTILILLLESSGFAIFLMAFMKQFSRPMEASNGLFIIAVILILLGAIISMGLNVMVAVGSYKHLEFSRFVLYTVMWVLAPLSAVFLSMFVFTQMRNSPAAKLMAVLALGTTFTLLGLSIISCILTPEMFTHGKLLYIIGMVIMWMGYFIKNAAIILFLLAYLAQRPLPPQSGVVDPSPEPAPVLSAEEPLPGEE
ncbi:MAG: hypothetical protein ACYSU8_10665 [Planctomycetota bacterium]|jgi:hypothetical protein